MEAETAREPLAPMLALVDACEPVGLVELERVLSLHLSRAPAKATQRVQRMRALTLLLESPLANVQVHHPISPRWVNRRTYDRVRPAGTPTSKALVAEYGGAANDGWWWACRSADGILEDGRKNGPGLAWANTMRGRVREPRASRLAVQASIRGCAMALGYVPTSSVYVHFVDVRRKATLERGGEGAMWEAGWRSIGSVYQHYEDWPTALAATRIDLAKLEAVRAARLPETAAGEDEADVAGVAESSPEARISALPPAALAAAGFTESERERFTLRGWKAIRQLPLSRAVELAIALDGSLDWLAYEDTDSGEAPGPGLRFDAGVFREARAAAGIHEAAVLAKARVSTGAVRRWGNGSAEPTVGELRALSRHTGNGRMASLCERPQD